MRDAAFILVLQEPKIDNLIFMDRQQDFKSFGENSYNSFY